MESDPLGNIWVTSRVRMDVHAKFVRMDKLSHILLTVYSVALVGFSLFSKHLENTSLGPYLSDISVILSVSVLCASLIVWGLGFNDKARDHRDCYLALQKLYDDKGGKKIIETGEGDDQHPGAKFHDEAIQQRYHALLDKYPNHTGLDYNRFLFRVLHIEKNKIIGKNGPVKMPWSRAIKYLIVEFMWFLLIALVILSPALMIAAIYVFA